MVGPQLVAADGATIAVENLPISESMKTLIQEGKPVEAEYRIIHIEKLQGHQVRQKHR